MMRGWRGRPSPAYSDDTDPLPAALLEQAAEHLRRFRGTMPDADFDSLVRDVVRMKLRWDQTRTPRAE
jgi:hypothetical protein